MFKIKQSFVESFEMNLSLYKVIKVCLNLDLNLI